MTKLTMLGKPYVNNYNAQEVFVFVGYGEEATPKDHLECPLGEENAEVFKKYVEETVLTSLRLHFGANGNYKVNATMIYPDNSIFPAILITRFDKKQINPSEIEQIQTLLMNAIDKINRRNSKNHSSGLSSVSLFSNQSAATAAAPNSADDVTCQRRRAHK